MKEVLLAVCVNGTIGAIVGFLSGVWVEENNKSIWYVFIPIGIWVVVSLLEAVFIKAF